MTRESTPESESVETGLCCSYRASVRLPRFCSAMANEQQQQEGVEQHGGAGPEEKEGSAKSNTVSSSTGPGGGLGKRPAEGSSTAGDQRRKQAVPFKISKPSISTTSPILKKPAPISIKLGASKPKEAAPPPAVKKPASVFNEDSDDSEPEEMPPEAKMRMKNIGRCVGPFYVFMTLKGIIKAVQ
uniref:PEST proteolytic signal-containing nuclear protein n=1 Tax=Astyanax mexicanus TaxID=7994 RepID=A0A3B1ILD5_ASTMX